MHKKKWVWSLLIFLVFAGLVTGRHTHNKIFFEVKNDASSYTYEIIKTISDQQQDQQTITQKIIIPQYASKSQLVTISENIVKYTLEQYKNANTIYMLMYEEKEADEGKNMVHKVIWDEGEYVFE